MGPSFPEKPENCAIEFKREDPTTVNINYHIIAQIQVSGVNKEGHVLSDELTPELQAAIGPAACKLGADTVSPSPSFAAMAGGGTWSSVGFFILRKRDQPLQMPMMPGMTPPPAPSSEPPAKPTEPPAEGSRSL
ncbi:MAG: hypothetical protein HOW73_00445 [Polyangiaceae bacterium]|nr:hypothetical protein [Polyangiaceae bacterium]